MKSIKRILPAFHRRWVQAQSNHRIQQVAKKVQKLSPSTEAAPVVFFNASTRLGAMSLNAGFSLLTSWAVRLQGVPVIHFVCDAGMSHCVLGTRQDDPSHSPPCNACRAQSRVNFLGSQTRRFRFHQNSDVYESIKKLSLAELENYERDSLPLGKLVLPSVRWILRRHHLLDNESTGYLFRQYILSAWNIAQKFLAMLENVTPSCVVVFNGQFFPEATVRNIAIKKGIRVITHEVGLLPFTGFFTEDEATAYPISIPADFKMTDKQNERLDAYLSNRFQGHFSMAGVQFWPEIRNLSPEFMVKLNTFKQIVPVFTNVVFDTSQGHANTLYSDMFSWLDDILEVIKKHPDTLFVIRAHPDEQRAGKESRESVAEWVVSRAVADLANVHFIKSTDYISSYEIVQLSKFLLLYNSTIGLEASILGKAVLSAGKARYTQVSSVFLPENREEYLEMLEAFLHVESVEPSVEHRSNARKFLYYQLFCSSLPFDAFLEEDRVWRGYVRLKPFTVTELSPESSQTIRVLLDGILAGKPFLLEP